MIASGAVWPKINHNFFSRSSNYALFNSIKQNECLFDSTYFEIGLSFLSQDIENLQKYSWLFLIERRATDRRFASIGRLKNTEF
jgi:hypothetical protein